jgi:3-phosphoshikimate 1-carboxyvinyltransferase
MDKIIKPIERLRGEVELPGDKSISHRVVFIGGISRGNTDASNFLSADDTSSTVSAFREMGIDVKIENRNITIIGKGLKGLKKPDKELYLSNSGTTMRILPGILAGQDFEATLTGDESLSRRPMGRIIEPLKKMGVNIFSKNKNALPPLVIKGGAVKSAEHTTKVASAQVKSCILFAGLYANGITRVTEPFISRDHTERMLEFCGAKISKKNLTVSVEGNNELEGKKFFIPGDISSAAFFIAGACLLEGSDVTIRNVGLNPTRTGFLSAIKEMGADITIKKRTDNLLEPYGDIRVKHAELKSIIVEEKDLPLLIDEVQILAVLASQAKGRTVIRGIAELKVKETNRVHAMTENLKRAGVDIKTENENLIINGREKRFEKCTFDSFKDHRTIMSAAITALYAGGDCQIEDIECVGKSFPEFFDILDHLKK